MLMLTKKLNFHTQCMTVESSVSISTKFGIHDHQAKSFHCGSDMLRYSIPNSHALEYYHSDYFYDQCTPLGLLTNFYEILPSGF